MPEVVNVRSQKCMGCAFSKTAIATNKKVILQRLKASEDRYFLCHCHDHTTGTPVYCYGYWKAYPQRFKNQIVRFVKKKGKFWSAWGKVQRKEFPEQNPEEYT